MTQRITILGIGNLLLKDEGLGIHALKTLEERYDFPPQVRLVDGGVLGLGLLSVLSESEFLIVLDAVKNGERPGTVYRIDEKEIPTRIRAKNSLHQIDFLETLAASELIGKRPKCTILGIEPKDIESVDIELSPEVADAMEELIGLVILELHNRGIVPMEKPSCALQSPQR
ncbi:MAG: HyaD/HybD family hydrogenase maturation endopeptidase [Desulfatiglandales bacterium]